MIIVEPSAEIIDHSNLLETIEIATRTCYQTEPVGDPEEFIAKRMRAGHNAVLEHGIVTVRFVCDRGVSHELVRHRLASFCQESTRYCNYSKDQFQNQISVIDPSIDFGWNLEDEVDLRKHEIWEQAQLASEQAYFEMLRAGAPAQVARSVLTNSLKTTVVMSANPREWNHFFALRAFDMAGKAHPSMHTIAYMAWELFSQQWPVLFPKLVESAT